jgi:actin-related protein 5
MSELIFECYHAPSVSYNIDALLSFYQNGYSMEHGGIICSLGHSATHVLPIWQGRCLFELCQRLSFGGSDAEEFMLKLMQTKYPTFPSRMSSLQARVSHF